MIKLIELITVQYIDLSLDLYFSVIEFLSYIGSILLSPFVKVKIVPFSPLPIARMQDILPLVLSSISDL